MKFHIVKKAVQHIHGVLIRSMWVIAGILLAVPFLVPSLWWCIVPGAAALLWFLLHPAESHFFLKLVSIGSAKAGAGIIWFWSIYPFGWLVPVSAPAQLALLFFYWATTALSIGLGFALLWWLIRKKISGAFLIIVFPALLVCADVIGSLAFSLYSLGPGSVPNFNFSFGYVGYALMGTEAFHSVVAAGGVYTLGFTVGILGIVLLMIFRRWWRGALLLAVAGTGIIVLLPVGEGAIPAAAHASRTVIIETAFPASFFEGQRSYELKARAVRQAVDAALATNADLIVLPEDSRFVRGFRTPDAALEYISAKSDTSRIIIDSSRTTDARGNTILRAYLFDTGVGTVYTVDKQYLVPQGEFLTYLTDAAITVLGSRDFTEELQNARSYRPGTQSSTSDIPETIPRILFCTESVVPRAVSNLMPLDGTLPVIHLISHAWFHESEIMWFNLERMLRVQALWAGTVIIEAANQKESVWYGPDGSVHTMPVIARGAHWLLRMYQ